MTRKKKIQSLVKFGKNIKRMRMKIGLSQEHLAVLVGVHRTTIGELERGDQNPSLINITKIAGALNVSLTDLLEGIEAEKFSEKQVTKKLTEYANRIMKEAKAGYTRQASGFY